jgi:hypothetical protein
VAPVRDRNRVWFVPDEWLFERKPTIHIDGADGPEGLAAQGIIDIDTTGFDVGLPTAEHHHPCFLPRWGGAPGAVTELENLGALDGVADRVNDQDSSRPSRSRRSRCSARPKKKEPAPKTNTVQLTETRPEAGSVREAIVAAAKKALKQKNNYFYLQHRPMHGRLFENELSNGVAGPVQPMGIDCSSS